MKKYMGLIIFIVIVVLLIIVALMPTDEEKYMKDVTLNEVNTKIEKKEDFILYVKQTNCEHCKAFTPKFASALKDYKLTAYVVNLTDLTEEESSSFKDLTGVDGTPTVFFYKEGQKSMVTIEGEQTKDRIKSKIKSSGFLKEKK